MYDDLKDLYNRVIPEMIKFEGKIMDFETENKKHALIIRQFDESISSKSNKA